MGIPRPLQTLRVGPALILGLLLAQVGPGPLSGPAQAAGGCGSVCLPLASIDPEKSQLGSEQFRISITTEWANFNNFREGEDSVTNRGGNEAKISQTTLFLEYGLTERWTVSALVPYVYKRQKTDRFGTRRAKGMGDPSVFASFELIPQGVETRNSLAIGLGLKFPLGSISEPDSSERLPPPFQLGSGAFDLVPTLSYYHDLEPWAFFGSAFARIPLEENRRDYKFGNEYEVSAGGEYQLPFWQRKVSLLTSVAYLYAEHDRDSGPNVPLRLRSGRKVLNTGGQFLDVVPGIRVQHGRYATQARIFLPIIENWNGRRSRDVGQVAPDYSLELSIFVNF